MRFPLSLTRSLTSYLLRKKLSGQQKFPLVLMLEPLHACNLTCTGCGRIREYADTITNTMSLRQCLDSVDECGAPVVSISGGEPLIYRDIEQLVAEILQRRKHVYLCTNGLRLEEKLAGFRPSSRLLINVHLDGLEATHDSAVGREGVFAKAIQGIRAAKAARFMVSTNTTVYRGTDMLEIALLYDYLTELGVDGFMISPAYGYQAIQQTDPTCAKSLFMTRQEIRAKFRTAKQRLERYRLVTSPIYLEFLAGQRELKCAAWANPTRNVKGWKGPCYLITDAHYASYQELLDSTDWDRFGPAGDPRCEHCLVHCGFEPAAVLSAIPSVGRLASGTGSSGGGSRSATNGWAKLRDMVRMAVWQMM